MLSYTGQIFSFIGVIHCPKLSILIESTVLETNFLPLFVVFVFLLFFVFFLTIRIVHSAHFFNQLYLLGLTIIG